MGCLLELFTEVLGEGISDLIGYSYINLMQLIVPHKLVSEKTKKIIKIIANVFTTLLAVTLITGVFIWVQDDPNYENIGKYMVFVSLGIMVLQIVLGIILKIVEFFKR